MRPCMRPLQGVSKVRRSKVSERGFFCSTKAVEEEEGEKVCVTLYGLMLNTKNKSYVMKRLG